MITEIITFKKREETTTDQLVRRADKVVSEFHKKQEGYYDMELICNNSSQLWQMIVHYQSMNDIEKVKKNISHSTVIKSFTELILPETMEVTFYEQLGKWSE